MKDVFKYPPLESEEVFQLVMWMLDPKAIDGAIKSAIHAHGPISYNAHPILQWREMDREIPKLTLKNVIKQMLGHDDLECDNIPYGYATPLGTCGSSSAAKRIRGAMKTRVEEFLKEQFEKKSTTDVSQA